jgi:predicted O-methyltransferase YrrM
MTYADLPGWFDFADLYTKVVAEAADGAALVELGVYAGKSLAFLSGLVMSSGKRIDVFGVDRFTEIPLEQVEENLKECGTGWTVTLIRSDTAEAADRFADGSVDFCFLDGDHSYLGVARDIAAWRPKMRAGGIMAGHDRVRTGVDSAVRDSFGEFEFLGPLAWWVRV